MKINNTKNSEKILGSINNYILKEDIGHGNFGKMKLAIYKPTGDEYAVKIMNKDIIKQKMKNIAFRENEIVTRFHHINVINVFELIEDKENFYIIMEYCQNGELFEYIVKNKKLSDVEASMFFYQLINGVSYIHKKGVAHRDLKPENILLTKDKVLKIIDFGLSHEVNGDSLLKTKCGSPSYAAPELINDKNYNGFKIDTWCCGIILYSMVCGYLPFDGENSTELFKSILKCEPEYPDFLSKNCKKLIKSILVTDPNKRITLEEIKLSDFYLQGKEFCKINYNINLEELDKKSYLIKEEDNRDKITYVSDDNESIKENINKINNENNFDKKENKKGPDLLTNNKYKDFYDNIEAIIKKYNKVLDDNVNDKENQNIKNDKDLNDNANDKQNQNIKNDKNGNIQKEKSINDINVENENKKPQVLLSTINDYTVMDKYPNMNSNSSKNKMNSLSNTFRLKIIKSNKNINNISSIKNIINDDNYKYNNILEMEAKDHQNHLLNEPIKLNTNINSNNNSININNNSKSNKYFSKEDKGFRLLETNTNEFNKSINKFLINTNDDQKFFSLHPQLNIKLSKKVVIDSNNSNNRGNINSMKERLNNFTNMKTVNNFNFENMRNKSFQRNIKKIPPIKNGGNILINTNLYCNDLNININNLNINNNNENFNNLNNFNDTNFLINTDKIKININNINNNNENIGNYIKFKNNVINKNKKNNSKTVHKIGDNTFTENITYNNPPRDISYKQKNNVNKIITNYGFSKKILKNSIDLSNINNQGFLRRKIFNNYYNNNINITSNSNNINDTNNENDVTDEINKNKTINNNKTKKLIKINNNNSLEKTPKNTKNKESEDKFFNFVKKNYKKNKNSIDNSSRNNNNIKKIINKYDSKEEKDKINKGYKYQIAIKEFIDSINNCNNTNNNNKLNTSGNNNKNFLPYL